MLPAQESQNESPSVCSQPYSRDCFLTCFLRWWESVPGLSHVSSNGISEGCVCLRCLLTSQINSQCTDVPWGPTVLHVLWEVFEGYVWCGRGESSLQNATGKPVLHSRVRVYSACEHGNTAVPLSSCGWFEKEVPFAISIGESLLMLLPPLARGCPSIISRVLCT